MLQTGDIIKNINDYLQLSSNSQMYLCDTRDDFISRVLLMVRPKKPLKANEYWHFANFK